MQKPKKIAALLWGAMLLFQVSIKAQQINCTPDIEPPTFTGPLDITISCNSLTLPGITGAPTRLQDNCDPSPSTRFTDVINAGSCPAASTILRSWIASDSTGNDSPVFLQTITVTDQTAPGFVQAAQDTTLYCPESAIAEAAFTQWLTDLGGAVATDDCSATNQLTWFVAVPGSYDLNVASTFPGTAPGTFNPAVCPSGRPGAYRFETVDFVVVDECGNARKSTATFALGDTLPPRLSNCPTDTLLPTRPGGCDTSFTLPVPQISKACLEAPTEVLFYFRIGGGTLQIFDTLNPPTLTLVAGHYPMQYVAIDCGGNQDSCAFTITVQDQEIPHLSCPADTTIYLTNNRCQIDYQLTQPIHSDNCSDPILRYELSGIIQRGLNDFTSPDTTLELGPGQMTVQFQVEDSSGLSTSCQYNVQVIDSFPPEIQCLTTTVTVNPDTGLVLDPVQLIAMVSDNCGVDSLWVSPERLDCSQIGDTLSVEIFARDSSGLITSCNSMVIADPVVPQPSYRTDLCTGDTLILMANPPPGDYDFLWTGPVGFQSVQENPSIPSAGLDRMGSYVLQITGPTGCTATASVDVVVTPRPAAPVLQLSATEICSGDSVRLSTPTVLGSQVSYRWYSGVPPTGSLLATTTQSSFMVHPLVTTAYYVEVELGFCSSLPGLAETVTVIQSPPAMTNDSALLVCEGAPITLGTSISGPDITYRWTGPNGFNSTDQFPTVIDSATSANAGVYELMVFQNSCPSTPDETLVFLKSRPDPAAIAVSPSACEGTKMTLTASVPDGTLYTWISPVFDRRLTTTSELILEPLEKDDEGNWQVIIEKDGCTSLPSSPALVDVFSLPEAIADNSGPVCERDSVQLIANVVRDAQYRWRGPNAFSAADATVRIPAIGGTYELMVTSAEGCTNTATTQVIVNPAPQITALSRTGDACGDGSAIRLIASVFPADPNGLYGYDWSGPNGFSSSEEQPLLPTGTTQDTGVYRLQIVDLNNCTSEEASINVRLLPVPIQPVISGQQSICEADTLRLMTTNYPGTTVSYEWTTPAGQITTIDPMLEIPNAGLQLDGLFSLRVFVDGCFSLRSTNFSVTIRPLPASPEVTSNSPVCWGENLQLSTTPIANTVYEWVGPDNFRADVSAPERLSVTDEMAGAYRLRITQNGCTSPFSTPEFVQVKPLPSIPDLGNEGPVCLDTPGERIRLNIVGNATPGAVYSWYDASTDQLLFGPAPSTSFEIALLNGLSEGVRSYYVIASLDGCENTASLPTTVALNEIPLIPANAGDDELVCQDDQIRLSAENPPLGFGRWLQTGGAPLAITDSLNPRSEISGLTRGTYELTWILSNGACQDYAGDELTVTVYDTLDRADAGENQQLCNVTEAFLAATPIDGSNMGFWSQSLQQQNDGVQILNGNETETQISGLVSGNNYRFVWSVGNPACGVYDVDTLLVVVEGNTAVAETDPDYLDCGRGSAVLFATDPVPGTGRWRALDSGPVILDETAPETLVNGLEDGEYGFEWSVDNGDCGIFRDTLWVTYHLAPVATDDEVEIVYNGAKFFSILDNDLQTDDASIRIISDPQNGSLTDLGAGLFAYQIGANFTGTDVFTYELCSPVCLDVCTTAEVSIRIDDDVPCDIPTIFTPNNDGVNDAFVIPCLSTGDYPASEVKIFNQWGDIVFQASPYNNQWTGERNGVPLPSGTYYFLIDFGQGGQTQSGFLILER